MFCEEVRTKQELSYISICSLSILYNSKFIIMATALGTNAVAVTRVHSPLETFMSLYGISKTRVNMVILNRQMTY